MGQKKKNWYKLQQNKNNSNKIWYYKFKRKPAISRIPKSIPFKRFFKILISNNITIKNVKKTKLQYGFIGLQALQTGYLTLSHIDILKKFLYPAIKNKHNSSLLINLYIKIFTTHTLTEKPLQSRIGRGKGLPALWYCKIYKNEVILEVRNTINQYYCAKLLNLIIKKLPLKIRIIRKKELKIGSLSSLAVIKRNPLKNIYIA